jgi:hypothetical protein
VPARGRPAGRGGATVQAYYVLGASRLWQAKPAKLPWSGYPYAVVGTMSLPAQQKRGGLHAGEDEYLDQHDNTAANIVNTAATATGLRVADSYEMAIEHSNLTLRQPKTFFATDAVLTASGAALHNAGSGITLHKTGRSIVIVGWWSEQTLHEVRPQFNGGSPDRLPQNCNEMAMVVSHVSVTRPAPVAASALKTALGIPLDNDVSVDDLRNYAGRWNTRDMKGVGANTYAAPNVGEAYMIHSMTPADSISARAEILRRAGRRDEALELYTQATSRTWRDYQTGTDKTPDWPYHFAGVVAQSGADRITLENYARGDDRQANPDPRWFFQMYSTDTGQSFHEAHRSGDYINPITVAYRTRPKPRS